MTKPTATYFMSQVEYYRTPRKTQVYEWMVFPDDNPHLAIAALFAHLADCVQNLEPTDEILSVAFEDDGYCRLVRLITSERVNDDDSA